jgi:hypothetical protein
MGDHDPLTPVSEPVGENPDRASKTVRQFDGRRARNLRRGVKNADRRGKSFCAGSTAGAQKDLRESGNFEECFHAFL